MRMAERSLYRWRVPSRPPDWHYDSSSQPTMRIPNPKGNYDFVKGISPYSAGAVAARGFAIEHARLQPAPPLAAGFRAIDRHLQSLGRPRHALCGIELRSPRPFTFQGFADFNAGYVEILKA